MTDKERMAAIEILTELKKELLNNYVEVQIVDENREPIVIRNYIDCVVIYNAIEKIAEKNEVKDKI